MSRRRRSSTWIVALLAATSILAAACAPGARPAAEPSGQRPAAGASGGASQPAGAAQAPASPLQQALRMPLDELHQQSLAEGGALTYYGALAQINAEKIIPAFEQRFPGVKVEHIDATCDALVARVIAESRGGRVLGDVFDCLLEYPIQLNQRGLFFQEQPPEADAYPEGFRGPYWISTDVIYMIAAWNTNLVRPDETPRELDDFADPKWRGRIIAEPRDAELLMGFVRKHNSEEKATDLLKRIAANNVEFHKGHSDLAELIAAGHAAACITCYSHHYPGRIRRGAPLDYLLTEGIGIVNAGAVFKDAPHPYTAMLWHRWIHGEEGQQAYAEGGRTPSHPNVQPKDRTRPDKIYPMGTEEVGSMQKYQRVWNDVFQIRGT
jgi:iron(III) transport system substrate-binding protein